MLDFSSYHPLGLKKSLPFSQLVRIRRICSSDGTLEEQAAELCTKFMSKGYSRDILDNALQRARNLDRKSLVTPKQSSSKGCDKMVCVITFSPVCYNIRQSVMKQWHILSGDPNIGYIFKDTPIFAHKKARNLRDTLVKADSFTPP